MKKINLRSYKVEVANAKGENQEFFYPIKVSIENVVLASKPASKQQLSMPLLLRNAKIVEKIKTSKDYVLLEDEEYRIVKGAFDNFIAFSGVDVELCKRIKFAKDVPVKEDKKKK